MIWSVSPVSTTLPPHITMTRWHSARTTFRSCADEEVGEAAPPLQVAQEVDDLPLHGEIERRGRLVEQDELRVEHQRAGDGDALPLPAGEFVREAVQRVRVEPDIGERAADALVALAAVAADAVHDRGLPR